MSAGGEYARIERAHTIRVKHYVAHRVSVVKERQVAGWRALPTVAHSCRNREWFCVDCRIRARHERGAGIRGEVEFHHWMQLDTIWSHARLPVQEVEEADALHLHRNVC